MCVGNVSLLFELLLSLQSFHEFCRKLPGFSYAWRPIMSLNVYQVFKRKSMYKSTAGKRVISHCFPKLRTLRLLKLFKTFLCHSFRTYLQDRIENLVMLFCFSISTKIFVCKNYSNLLLNDVCSRKGKVMLIFMWSV